MAGYNVQRLLPRWATGRHRSVSTDTDPGADPDPNSCAHSVSYADSDACTNAGSDAAATSLLVARFGMFRWCWHQPSGLADCGLLLRRHQTKRQRVSTWLLRATTDPGPADTSTADACAADACAHAKANAEAYAEADTCTHTSTDANACPVWSSGDV